MTSSLPPADQAMEAGKPPLGTGLSPVFGQLVAALLIGLGVLGVQEAVYRVGLVATSWMGWLLDRGSGRTATFATLVGCVVLVLAGLVLLVVVIRPRPRRALRLTAHTGVFLRTGDLARLARDRIDGADGVIDVDASATRSTLSVEVTAITPPADNDHLQDSLAQRLRPLLDALDNAPRLKVSITNQELT